MIEYHSYRLPTEAHQVPTEYGGLYQICVRFPDDYEFGFARPFPPPQIAASIERFLRTVAPLFLPDDFSGHLHSRAIGLHLQIGFDLVAKIRAYPAPGDVIAMGLESVQHSATSLAAATASLRLAFSAAPPLYIGVTAKQSLQARLHQHLGGATDVAKALKKMRVPWRYLQFRCVQLPSENGVDPMILERLIQGIFKPRLCQR